RRYVRPVRPAFLSAVLCDPASAPSQPVGVSVDLGPVHELVREMASGTGSTRSPAVWDARLLEPLHAALGHLPLNVATDMCFWQWLAISELSSFVWHRWFD